MTRAHAVRSGGHAVTKESRDGVPVDVLKAWVQRSCAAQGLPVKVTDPAVLRQVGVLLGRSRPPAHLDAFGVEAGPTLDRRVDGDVVDEGADDGVLAGDGEAVPFIVEQSPVPDIAV